MASIFDRISTLIRANLNAVLDQAEDPEKVLDQIIRDMQGAINDARSQVAEMIARERMLRADVEDHRKLVAEWERKAELALTRNMEDLAREAVRRKLDYQKTLELSLTQWQTQNEVVERLKADLQMLQSKYENAVRQRDALIARHKAAQAREQVTRTVRQFSAIDPTSELARMEDRIRLAEARAEANLELQQVDYRDQFAALEGDSELEEEMARLRARVLGPAEQPAGQLGAPKSDGDTSA
ncbi:MAG: membrane protein [Dehalococcoidia bacterium]|nr:MAG: membrane protein [Dehalococcoidia bacterium]